jgi:hypothetical protein
VGPRGFSVGWVPDDLGVLRPTSESVVKRARDVAESGRFARGCVPLAGKGFFFTARRLGPSIDIAGVFSGNQIVVGARAGEFCEAEA